MAVGDGAIKTFPLRGIKDSPPYLPRRPVAERSMTQIEFFCQPHSWHEADQGEKADLVAFMKCL